MPCLVLPPSVAACNAKERPSMTAAMGCCGRLSLLPGLKLGRKQRKLPACYERLHGSKLASKNGVVGNVVNLARLGSARMKHRGDKKALVMKKMKNAYKQGLAMARQSGPHFAELFRGNHFLLHPMAAAPFNHASKAAQHSISHPRHVAVVVAPRSNPSSLQRSLWVQ